MGPRLLQSAFLMVRIVITLLVNFYTLIIEGAIQPAKIEERYSYTECCGDQTGSQLFYLI